MHTGIALIIGSIIIALLAGCQTQSAPSAKEKNERIEWLKADSTGHPAKIRCLSILDLENYLTKYPNGEHSSNARAQLEELEWERARENNTVTAYEAFLGKYPAGIFLAQAKTELSKFARIVASLPRVISGSPDKGNLKYTYTVTFIETRGVAAKVEDVSEIYRDKNGKDWYLFPTDTSTSVEIAPHGTNTYHTWFSLSRKTLTDHDLRTLVVFFHGHDQNGHWFSGEVQSPLGQNNTTANQPSDRTR